MSDEERLWIVEHYLKQNANIVGLWGIYIAAAFTGAAFSVTDVQIGPLALAAVTLGFWTFAVGHLILLWRAVRSAQRLEQAMRASSDDATEYARVVAGIDAGSDRRWSSGFHLVIDLCVTLLIWRSALPGGLG